MVSISFKRMQYIWLIIITKKLRRPTVEKIKKILPRQENENNGGSHRWYRRRRKVKPPLNHQTYCPGPWFLHKTSFTQYPSKLLYRAWQKVDKIGPLIFFFTDEKKCFAAAANRRLFHAPYSLRRPPVDYFLVWNMREELADLSLV
jgi:hypothetical protein